MKVLITGSAGFIGFHLSKLLLAEGFTVHGYDGLTDYRYPVSRHCMVGSLTGAVASQIVTEACEGKLRTVRNRS